jgi:hypothetical protein
VEGKWEISVQLCNKKLLHAQQQCSVANYQEADQRNWHTGHLKRGSVWLIQDKATMLESQTPTPATPS